MPRTQVTQERYINQDILAARIAAAELAERQERESAKGEKVKAHSDQMTNLFTRINAASEGDTLEIRRAQELNEILKTDNENLKAEEEETREYNQTLREEIGSYL
ncbi:MAG: hypothetical protein G01um10147_782 [Microgenomates group bacterium Gr01-1014_7]|nr:MAG: hypothetical protein G01um10147_782 [Microgenomates group bacterium Gr01-1014_7]